MILSSMDRPEMSRRTVLGSSALTIAGLAGCLGGATDTDEPNADVNGDSSDGDTTRKDETNENDKKDRDPPENGAVVFVYDDGPMEDYTKAFPVHQEFDAPATSGIISEYIGYEDYQTSGCMEVKHLKELADAGWEIASHTLQHNPVGTYELVEDVDSDDEYIYPEQIHHGYLLGTIQVTDGEQTVRCSVADYGSDDIGGYIELEERIGQAYAAGEAVVRYPPEWMHKTLGKSKRDLEELGFEVDTFLAPYDNFDDYSRRFAPEYYDGIANANHGSRINDREDFDPYRTHRDYFVEFSSRKAVKRDLDEIAERGALGILGAHTFKEEVSKSRIRETLEWVEERDIEVMTLREAIAWFADDQ